MPIGTSTGEYYNSEMDYVLAQLDKPQIEKRDLPPPGSDMPEADLTKPRMQDLKDILDRLGTVPDRSPDVYTKKVTERNS